MKISPLLLKTLAASSLALLTAAKSAENASPDSLPRVKVAVTDLVYEEQVAGYFRNVQASAHASSSSSMRSSGKASASARESARSGVTTYPGAGAAGVDSAASYQGAHNYGGQSSSFQDSSFSYSEGLYSYILRGELRKFTADVKGEMLKSGMFRVMQARPYTAKDTEKIYDVIERIKKGMYPGADYVLFGSVSSVQFRLEANPGSSGNVSHVFSLELVGDFSLIHTKTYEIKAAFSATGEGRDVRISTSAGGRFVPSRGKVIRETSKSLGEDVIRQLEEQFGGVAIPGGTEERARPAAPEPREIIHYE
ncbi:MAG: penicillin-binding protein activator LpoB [Zoogloeaceae bacterium]|nr:penicillin-binding protein activator LpoB [Zoogloeaceae bacterium]